MNDTETKKPIFTVAWGQRIQDLWTIKKWSIFSRNFVEKIFPGSDGSTDRAWANRIQSSFLNFRRFLMIVKKFGSSREEITSGCLVSRNSLSHNKELIKPVKNFCACAWQWTSELLNSCEFVGCESELVKLKTWFSSNVTKIELTNLNEDESNL